jgi:RHS repeat-associated protein
MSGFGRTDGHRLWLVGFVVASLAACGGGHGKADDAGAKSDAGSGRDAVVPVDDAATIDDASTVGDAAAVGDASAGGDASTVGDAASFDDSGANADGGVADPDGGAVVFVHACASAAIDRTTATSFYEAMRCLFEGQDAPQKGVTAGSITPERIAVVRGMVHSDQGAPLAGVRVTAVQHPEWGYVLTASDGSYDMAVNGGGLMALRFEGAGVLPAQRHLDTGWRAFAVFPDVVLLPASATATAVALATATGPIVARGDSVTDSSGTRRQDVLFRPGTHATMTLADGTKQPLDTFHLRMTEYTVGDRGPQAMPGDLPAASAYTYAVDFSADEARAVGAVRVDFDQPVVAYTTNFLNFPAGTVVPTGYYDAASDTWQAGVNGVVLTVLTTSATGVEVDTDGDGKADDATRLAAVGIDAPELAALGGYAAGTSLWRVALPHFSPWDHNWPFRPPPDAVPPVFRAQKAEIPAAGRDCPSTAHGSIIGCETQSLGEVLPISGTSFSLHYQSDRVPGRRDGNQLSIPLSGATIPTSLKSIELEVEVLGVRTARSFPAVANSSTTFEWDGKDGYGRLWQGRQDVRVQVGYTYDGYYQQTSGFANPGRGVAITGDRARKQVTIWSEWRGQVGQLDTGPLGIGGWTIDANHVYDPSGGVLTYGDGGKRSREAIAGAITTVAGTGVSGVAGDNGPAISAQFRQPHGLVVAADGTAFVADDTAHRIRKIAPDGTITLYAGTGTSGYTGDGGNALAATLNAPMGMALAPDGTLFFADNGNRVVRKITPDGTISTIAGGSTNSAVLSPDMPVAKALDVVMAGPHAVALAPDGSLYVTSESSQTNGSRVYRLDPSGYLSLIAGSATGGDGIPASMSAIDSPTGIAVNAQGEIFVVQYGSHKVRKIDRNGIITTVAGTGTSGFTGDGGPATAARLSNPHTVDVGPDGSLYIADEGNGRIRRVAPDGHIETIAGGGSPADGVGDNGAPTSAKFNLPRVVVLAADGTTWVAEYNGRRIRRIRPSLPGYSTSQIVIPSESGDLLYAFDAKGRHMMTVDAITNLTLLSFGYDTAGRLASIKDAAGNETRIERTTAGAAVVGPFGERTTLAMGTDGYLASVTNAAGETTAMTYGTGGLLATMTDPRDPDTDVHRFTYDSAGRLAADESPTGELQMLDRSGADNDVTVALRSRLGRTTSHRLQDLGAGSVHRVITGPDGLAATADVTPGGSTVTSPTGTVRKLTYQADPRFGMQAAYVSAADVKIGSFASVTMTRQKVAHLSNANDPTSLVDLTETVTTAGLTSTDVWSIADGTHTSTSPAGRTAVTTWDTKGRIVQRQVGTLTPQTYEYDDHDRITKVTQGDRATTFTYDDVSGRLASATDPLQQTLVYARDAVGRVTKTTLPDTKTVQFGYDLGSNLTSLTPPGGAAHAFGYLSGGLPGSYTPPTVTGTGGASYSYDGDGTLIETTRPDGKTIDFKYDPTSGRLLQLVRPDTTITYSYVAASGLLAGIARSDETIAYTYNGELPTQVKWSGAVAGTVSFAYKSTLQLDNEKVGSTAVATYTYDGDGLVTKAGSETLAYDADNGLLASTALGVVTDAWQTSSLGEPTKYAAQISAADAYVIDGITRDAGGRLTAVSETLGGETHTAGYAYDARGRVSEVQRDGAAIQAFTYDDNGNRLSQTGASGTIAYSYDAQDRLVTRGDTTYTYAPGGELAKKATATATTTYSYDPAGALTAVTLPDGTAITYVVDGVSRRVGKKRNGSITQEWLYRDGLRPIAELGPTGSITALFVYASRPHVPDQVIKGTTTYRIITDLRGSVRLVVNTTTGEVVQQLDYDTFGNVTTDTNPGFQPFGFAGGLYDPDTHLVRFGARDYDAETGRWTAKDPSGFGGGGTNLYVYAANDPVNSVDIDGHSWASIRQTVGVAAGRATDIAIGLYSMVRGLACVEWSALSARTSRAFQGAIAAANRAFGWVVGESRAAANYVRVHRWETLREFAPELAIEFDAKMSFVTGKVPSSASISPIAGLMIQDPMNVPHAVAGFTMVALGATNANALYRQNEEGPSSSAQVIPLDQQLAPYSNAR